MGIGFFILLAYRLERFIRLILARYSEMNEMNVIGTVIPFVGAVFLLMAFWRLSKEHAKLIESLVRPSPLRAGAQPVEYWLSNIRKIFREELERWGKRG